MGVFSILILAHVLFRFRQRYRAGQKVDVNQVIGAIIIFSIFMVISISQVITHGDGSTSRLTIGYGLLRQECAEDDVD
jgi:hypothetical protein